MTRHMVPNIRTRDGIGMTCMTRARTGLLAGTAVFASAVAAQAESFRRAGTSDPQTTARVNELLPLIQQEIDPARRQEMIDEVDQLQTGRAP